MNVLNLGAPFCCDYALLDAYRGRHDVRWLGMDERARYHFNPLSDSMRAVVNRLAREWPPDLVLCWTPEIYPPPLAIEDSPIPTAALVSDWNVHYAALATNLTRFDLVLCDRPGVAVLRRTGVNAHHFFPLYSQITPIHRNHAVQRDLDLVYAGSLNAAAHPRRARLLHRLANLSGRYRVFIGSGVVGEAYAQLLSRARIVFNCSVRGELNLRVFETIACGALPLVEDDNAEVRDCFTNDGDVVLYDDSNLESRIAGLLANPGRCEAIAARAHARAYEWAGENRFDALIDWVAAQPSGGRPFRGLSAEERSYQDLLLFGFSRWNAYAGMRESLAVQGVKQRPNHPRAWTAFGRHILPTPDAPESSRACLKAFAHAHRLAPDSAPYALNAATVCRSQDHDNGESEYLHAVLAASSLDGSETVLGNPACPFWNRWTRAVAEGRESLDLIHAESRIRLATLLARYGQLDRAIEHLINARTQDPGNHSGDRLEAEIVWTQGRRREAVELLRERAGDHPLDVEYRTRLAGMFDELAMPESARGVRDELNRLAAAQTLPES